MKKISILLLIIFASCKSTKEVAAISVVVPHNILINGKLFTALFQQHAAEYRALCFQAFNIARVRIDQSLQNTSAHPPAIITDIDETILDNSRYDVHQALQGKVSLV
jgi:5'-nucleotidase (lipoprotein e(P4) family)